MFQAALDDSPTTKAENRKIRDQLKLQVQERKLLLKKISMLKEQLGAVSDTRSYVDCKTHLKESRRISEEKVENTNN